MDKVARMGTQYFMLCLQPNTHVFLNKKTKKQQTKILCCKLINYKKNVPTLERDFWGV